MLNKILFLVILLIVLLIVFLLNPWQQKIPTQVLTIKVNHTQKSALDKVLLPHLKTIKQNSSLIKSLTQTPKTISTQGLWADKYEVSQANFYKFISWIQVHNSPAFFAQKQPQNWRFYSSSKNHGLSGRLEVGANGVSFYDAFSYCRANGARLPSYDEFRIIAQAKSGQLYPWGDKFYAKSWPYYDARLNATLKAGSFPHSDTQEGVADLGAILSEWTLGNYPQGKPFIQGGNAYSKPREIYALNMIYRTASYKYRSAYVGFRCVYDKKPNQYSPWKNKLETVYIAKKTLKINHHPNATIPPLLRYLPNVSLKDFKSSLSIHRQSDYRLSVGINEVSVAEYAQFLADFMVFFGVYAHPQQPKNHQLTPPDWSEQQKTPHRPVVNIDWWSAYHFANWAGGRLPSNAEYIKIRLLTKPQKSLFKEQKQVYPNLLKSGNQLAHLLGNVSEWSRTRNTSVQNLSMIVKGGSFLIGQKRASDIDFHRSISPHHRAKDIGFRVVFE